MEERRTDRDVNEQATRDSMDRIADELRELIGDETLENMQNNREDELSVGCMIVPLADGVSAAIIMHGGDLVDYMYGAVSIVFEIIGADVGTVMILALAEAASSTIIDMANLSAAYDGMKKSMEAIDKSEYGPSEEAGLNIN